MPLMGFLVTQVLESVLVDKGFYRGGTSAAAGDAGAAGDADQLLPPPAFAGERAGFKTQGR